MNLPIVAYGDPLLRKKAEDISIDYPNLKEVIANMYDTMYNASGVGLAAPQIGLSVRLFIIDSAQILNKKNDKAEDDDDNDFEGEEGVKQVFINAKVHSRAGEKWIYNEGCLSIPNIREDITRPDEVDIEYLDEDFKHYRKKFSGFTGRIIQHEFDHIEGILFTDHLKPLKKRLLKNRLEKISRGDVKVDYKMKFPVKK
ncbi:MAG TPA: peptide deformylase [Bacteroidetes bacterium]|nr:peptide deformylase [Bacteroidota bacterium]